MVEDKHLIYHKFIVKLEYYTNVLSFNGNNGKTTGILICIFRERLLTYSGVKYERAHCANNACTYNVCDACDRIHCDEGDVRERRDDDRFARMCHVRVLIV